MSNAETALTLDEAVAEVFGVLTGLDLTYEPGQDRYRSIVRCLNRGMRSFALEKEWSYYSSVQVIGQAREGEQAISFPGSIRPRVMNDDAVRLVDEHGHVLRWAYFLPRDALHKYQYHRGIWCAVLRNSLQFSRPFSGEEDGLDVQLPVMREPIMFRLPPLPQDPNAPLVEVPDEIRNQEVDFPYPDVIVLRAAFLYAQTDPVMQPRVQTLEAQYKDLMYQIIERDERITDTPFQNGFTLGIQSGLESTLATYPHPHADSRP